MFQKKGVNKESGKYIYPELTQTGVGNCAAYSGAACLYAFGLDHEAGLIPKVNGGTPAEQFQAQTARMVEQMTKLIYTDGNSVAEGYRKYIEDAGLKDKFEVTTATGGSYELPDESSRSNFDFMKDELKRCQDVMVHIQWSKGRLKPWARHSIVLTGFDEANKKIRAMNPWGNPPGTTSVTPAEVGTNLDAGQTDRAHTDYDYTLNGDKVDVAFEGKEAHIYEYVKICPVTSAAAKAEGTSIKSSSPKPSALPTRRYDYKLHNNSFHHATRFGIKIPGLRTADVTRMYAPPGWASAIWYRSHTPNFELLAPEVLEHETHDDDVVGILYTAEEPLQADTIVEGFGFEVLEPREGMAELGELLHEVFGESSEVDEVLERSGVLLEKYPKWEDVSGGAVLASEFDTGTHAVHFDVLVPQMKCEVGDRLDHFLKLRDMRWAQ